MAVEFALAIKHSVTRCNSGDVRYNTASMPLAVDRARGRVPPMPSRPLSVSSKSSRKPALLEPGEDMLPLAPGNFALEIRGARLTFRSGIAPATSFAAWCRTKTKRAAGWS